MMKKTHIFIIVVFLLFGLISCRGKETSYDIIQANDPDVPYRIQTIEDGTQKKSYIENRQGIAEIFLSSEIRTDIVVMADQIEIEELEPYFAIAKETGLNTLELPFLWKMFETGKREYDNETINWMLDTAKAYDLKINLIWYGSFVDGESRTGYYPNDIKEDTDTYAVEKDLYDFGIFGRVRVLDWTDEDLLSRETYALYRLMNEVHAWNQANDQYDPIVSVQIGQGLDRFPRWRINQYEVTDDEGILMTQSDGWDVVNTYVDHMSRAVKYADYQPLTRIEFTEQNGVVGYVYDLYDLEYVDLVSPTYLHTIANVKTGIPNFQGAFPNMPIYNAQNWADDMNHKNLLASFALGAIGFNSYQLSAAVHYPEPPNGALYARIDRSKSAVSDMFEQNNQRVDDLKGMIEGLEAAYPVVAKTTYGNMLVLGMDTRLEPEEQQKLYARNGLMVTSTNPVDGLGFILSNKDEVLAYATKSMTLTFDHAVFVNASFGSYDDFGFWQNDGSVVLENNITLELDAHTLYRLRVASIDDLPDRIPEGFSDAVDAIRG
jgi:hypothetical protein